MSLVIIYDSKKHGNLGGMMKIHILVRVAEGYVSRPGESLDSSTRGNTGTSEINLCPPPQINKSQNV